VSRFAADVRFALRSMLKRPGTSALLVTTLAVGLAANAIVFNMLDAMVLRSFGFPNVPRLVRVWEVPRDFNGLDRSNVAPANLLDWREQSAGVFSGLVGMDWWDANLRSEGAAERVQGYRVSPRFFETLGVGLAQGRDFRDEEARPGQERRVVVGHALWQRSYGGAPLLDKTITIDGEPYQVVGIAAPGFEFPEGTEVWSPLPAPVAAEARRDQHYLSTMGLLADGKTRDDARAALSVVAKRLETEHPQTNTGLGIDVAPFRLGFGDPVLPQILAIWQVAAFLVLLIACVNVANLILARGAERQRELALRLALGAGRGRILRQLITEGAVAALAAVVVSTPLVALGARVLRDHMPAEIARFVPGWANLGADWRTLLFSALLALVATAAFSALPALRASRPDLNEALRDGGRSVTAGAGRQRGRSALVVLQLAAALVLVTTAGLAVRSASALLYGPQGYQPDGLLTFEVSLSDKRYGDAEKRRGFARDAVARLSEVAGVSEIAVTSALPGRGNYATRPIEIEGRPLLKEIDAPRVDARWVAPGYFETMRLPLQQGRSLESRDDENAPAVAVISRSMAEKYWPGEPAIGKRFRVVTKDGKADWLSVVGVSGDVIQQWVMRRNYPTFYRPLRQEPRGDLGFALRTAGDPEALTATARRAMLAIDPDQPAYSMMSMRRALSQNTIGMQYVAGVMAAFGVLALVLAVSGVYGVMSYRVSLRTLEIGVRVALGASSRDVLRLTLGQALQLASLGLGAGSLLAFAASRVISSTLRGAVESDPLLVILVTLTLGVATLIAAWVPARRALAVDPATALRSE